MSKTILHKELGKYHNGVTDYDDLSFKTKKYFDRYNFERGYFKSLKLLLIEKIMNRELNHIKLNENEKD